MEAMARPPKENRAEVRTKLLTFRVSEAEREQWHKLAAAYVEDMKRTHGIEIDGGLTSYVRFLINRDAQARGLDAKPTKTAAAKRRAKSAA